MKVKELIELLGKFDEDAEIKFDSALFANLDNLTRLQKAAYYPADTNLNTRYQFWYDARSDTGYIVDRDGNYLGTAYG